MELGYLAPSGHLVTVDTLGWRTLFAAIRFVPSSGMLHHLTLATPLERRSTVTVTVYLHRRGWSRRGEIALRRTEAAWYRKEGLDLFLGPKARAIRVPWRGELAKVHRPFFAMEGPIKDQLALARGGPGAPALLWLERGSVRGFRRSGRTVEVFAVERREFSDFVLGKLRATMVFPSEADAAAFAAGLLALGSVEDLDRATTADITRSKRIVWTPKVLLLVVGGLALFGFVVAGTVVGALEGKQRQAAEAAVEIAAGVLVASWALPLLLRVRRREFIDLLDKWPRVLCERWGRDYRAQAARAREFLRSSRVLPAPGLPDLMAVDAYLRSLPPEAFYGTLALQIGLLATDHLVRTVGREMDFSWEYLPDRRECAFRVDAAGLRVYPLTAVMTVWQMRDPEGLEPFVRTYARELQMRLAFRENLAAFVSLGFTAPGWDAFSKFAPRVDGELEGQSRARLVRREPSAVRERVLDYGAVRIVFMEEAQADGPGFVPRSAFPFVAEPARVVAEFDSSAEGPDIVGVVRVKGSADRLAVWVGASAWLKPGGQGAPELMEFCGVAGDASVIPGRGADPGNEATPSVTFDEADEEVPESARAVVRARIVEVAEGTNTFSGTPLWRLVLDLRDMRLPIVARRDAWPKPPSVDDLFVGTLWLFARISESG